MGILIGDGNMATWLPRKSILTIVGACFLLFLGVTEAKAEFTSISMYPTTNYHKVLSNGAGGSGLLWTATSTGAVNSASFALCDDSTTATTYNVYARAGIRVGSTISWVATSTNSIDELDIEQASDVTGCYGSLLIYTFNFDSFTVTSGTQYVIRPIMSEDHNNECYILMKHTYDTDFDILEGSTVQDTLTPRFALFYDPYVYDGDVEVIENPDYDPDQIIEIWSEEFSLDTKICYINMSYGSCEWTFNYSRDYDDGIAYLIYDQDPKTRLDAIASTSLPLVPIRQASFDVPIEATTGTRDYCAFLEKASSTDLYLSCGHQIKWVEIGDDVTDNASSTDLNIIWKFVDKVTNVFPISLAKQMWSIFAAAKDATTTPAILHLQDVMPDDGDDILGGTNPVLLSYALIQANLPIWDTIILRFMNYCVYLIGFFISIFLVFPKLREIDLGGHNKVPAPDSDGTIHQSQTIRSMRDVRPAKVGHTADLRYKYPKGVTDLRYK